MVTSITAEKLKLVIMTLQMQARRCIDTYPVLLFRS